MKNILNKIKECEKGSVVQIIFDCDGENKTEEGVVTSISQPKKQITIETDTDEWEIDFKDIIDIKTNSAQQETKKSHANSETKISNKIRTFVQEDPNASQSYIIPLDKITVLAKEDETCYISVPGWQHFSISQQAYEELLKYFEPVIIER